jgi:hypothetical protein
MAKATKPTVITPDLSGVVTVIGLKPPYVEGREYEMQAEHAKIIIQKQLVKLK